MEWASFVRARRLASQGKSLRARQMHDAQRGVMPCFVLEITRLNMRGCLRDSAFNGSGPITTGFQRFCDFSWKQSENNYFFDRFIARGLQKPVVCLAAPLMAADR